MKNIYKEIKRYIKNHIKHLGKYEDGDEFLDITVSDMEDLVGEYIPTKKMDEVIESCITYVSTLKEVKECTQLRNIYWLKDGTPSEPFVIGLDVVLNIKK